MVEQVTTLAGVHAVLPPHRYTQAELTAAFTEMCLGPDDNQALLARLHALSRRSLPLRAPQLQHADLVLNPITREVSRGGRRLSLTRTEYVLLEMLLRRSGIVLSRETLIEGVWGFGAEVENNTLEVFIGQLRAKVDRESPDKLIHTIRGVGYVMRDDVCDDGPK